MDIYPILRHHLAYWIPAFASSLYFGIRARYIQKSEISKHPPLPPLREQIIVNYIQDILMNFICSMAGWTALFVLGHYLRHAQNFLTMQTGAGLFLSFLALIAILGISGSLPSTLVQGKIFGVK